MSTTRRSTRATSRAASSRGASPALTENDVPATPSTRRVVRRATSTAPLPQVSTRPSNSYGSNTVPIPATTRPPAGSDQIQSVLGNLLDPVQEEGSSTAASGRGRRSGRRGPTSAPDRSFDLEKNVFDSANIDSSSLAASPDGAGIPELPTPRRRALVQQPINPTRVEEIARNTRVDTSQWTRLTTFTTKVATSFPRWLLLPILAFFVLFIAFSTNLHRTIPGSIGSAFSNSGLASGDYSYFGLDIKDLQNRMKIAETDIARLSKSAHFNPHTASTLEQILPDIVVCKKDKYGNIMIPDDFWHAMVDRLRKEDYAFDQQETKATDSGTKQTSGLSRRDVTNIAEKAIENSERVWKRFLENNKQRIQQWDNNDYESKVSHAVRDYADKYRQVDKDELIAAIKKNWADTQHEVQTYLRPIARDVEAYVQRVHRLEHKTIGKDEARSISSEVASRLISSAQLGALSKANINIQTQSGLLRVNHFSRGTGAVINKALVSPNYVFPAMDRHSAARALHWLVGRPIPSPNPPQAALESWEEHGDCWCSPSKDDRGRGPSLAVLVGNNIQPDQIIIEHLPTSAAIEPGSAPQEMELIAFIEDITTYHKASIASNHIFDNELGEEPESKIEAGWVRLATWTYDLRSDQNVQSFPLQMDLAKYGDLAFTKNVIVRAKNNWGGESVPYTCMYRVRLNGVIIRND